VLNWSDDPYLKPRIQRYTFQTTQSPNGPKNAETTFLTLAKEQLPDLVTHYINALETGTSDEWCKCVWQIHPDDQETKSDCCRVCGNNADDHFQIQPNDHALGVLNVPVCTSFKGRRMRRIDDHPMCPAHSKTGLVLGFFEWVYRDPSYNSQSTQPRDDQTEAAGTT
jgi:hypothetical protein